MRRPLAVLPVLTLLLTATSPREKRAIGIFAHDQNGDQRTDLTTAIPEFDETFITAADVFIPAAPGGAGIITIAVRSRAGGGSQQYVVPNWPSDTGRITINVSDS